MLVAHAMAGGVTDDSQAPVNETNVFSVNDSAAYSWLKLGNLPSPTHNVTWVWVTPQDHVYFRFSTATDDPGPGRYWQDYYLWSHIHISSSSVHVLPGEWKVRVYLDDSRLLVQNFSVVVPVVPTMPLQDFDWPTSVIPVYIDGGPSYARGAVLFAMKEWNFGQQWFQSTYSLPAKAIYQFVASNDSASPIQVTFNETQTNPNWLGYAQTHYWYNSSNMFYKATCQVSLDLTQSSGEPITDVWMKSTAMHELGHCLGLWHTTYTGDLMYERGGEPYDLKTPSTLDLYSVYEIEGLKYGEIPSSLALPSGIPYTRAPSFDGAKDE